VDEIVTSLTAAKELLSKVKIDKTATWNTPTTALFMKTPARVMDRQKSYYSTLLSKKRRLEEAEAEAKKRNAEIDAAVKENVATFTLKVEICENCNEEPNPVKLRCAFPRCIKVRCSKCVVAPQKYCGPFGQLFFCTEHAPSTSTT